MRCVAITLVALAMGPPSEAEEPPMAEVVRGNNRFAVDLYGQLRGEPELVEAGAHHLVLVEPRGQQPEAADPLDPEVLDASPTAPSALHRPRALPTTTRIPTCSP